MAYTERKGSFPSVNKRSNIYYRICVPKGNAKAVVQIAHGMCEYFDRYEDTIKYLTDRGYAVCGCDHVGHGHSAENDSELGYFGADDCHCLTEDQKQLTDTTRKLFRSLPYILIGHSMGSFVARDYMARYPDSVDGVILCGTSGTNKAVGMGIFICKLLEKVKGPKHRSKFVKNLSFKGYNSRFASEKDNNSWLTRERSVREAYANDKFCNYTFTVEGYKNMFSLLKDVSDPQWEKKVPKSLPVFIISGADDPVGDYGDGVNEIYDRLNAEEINILKMRLYEDCRHELFNETNRVQVWNDVADFVDEVIDGVLAARGYTGVSVNSLEAEEL